MHSGREKRHRVVSPDEGPTPGAGPKPPLKKKEKEITGTTELRGGNAAAIFPAATAAATATKAATMVVVNNVFQRW